MNYFFYPLLFICMILTSTLIEASSLAKKNLLKGIDDDGPKLSDHSNNKSLAELQKIPPPCVSPFSLSGFWEKVYWQTGDSFEIGNGERSHSYFISFHNYLCYTPNVMFAINGFDISNSFNQRLQINIVNVSHVGFTVSILTWADTKIYMVSLSWIAVKP